MNNPGKVDAQTLDEWFEFVLELTMECGKVVKEGYEESKKLVETKGGDWDVVTEYDRRVEDMMISGIAKAFPGHKFIGEETSAETDIVPELTDDPTWIIDPIDGTSNYVHEIPITCISVALAVNRQVQIGIIYNPMSNELYTARRGQGAFLNGVRMQTSNIEEISKAVVATEISLARLDHLRDRIMNRLLAVVAVAHGCRSFGSAALSLAYVARGSVDAYQIDDLYTWDVAAAVLMIQEAGGCVVATTGGGEFDLGNPKIIAGSTEKLVKTLVEIYRVADEQECARK